MKSVSIFSKILFIGLLWISSNSFAQDWQAFGPFGGQKFLCMQVDTTNDYLYLGTTEGFWYQNMESGIWTDRIEVDYMGRAVWSITANPSEPGTVITGRDNAWFKGYMEISYDYGETNEFLYESIGGWITDIKYSPADASIYYATTFSDGGANGEFLKSTDGGSSWEALPSPHFALTSIAVSPGTPNTIYISGDALVTKSTNGGTDWVSIAGNLPSDLGVYEVALNKSDENSLVCSNDNGLWQTTDGGQNWTNTFPTGCERLVYNPIETNMIAALTFNTNQILISLDNGKNWIDYTSDFPIDEYYKDIDFSKDGTKLFCTSYYNIYERELTLVGTPEMANQTNESLIKNLFPNPFKEQLAIETYLNKAQDAQIRIYNMMGQTMAILHNDLLQKGNSILNWDAKTIESGVYFCEIKLENGQTQTKRIIKQ
ncbi:MAG: hypothetical protein B7C24_07575 [Bacteroidetes bacterium 4572_77]|nr:MAG: hypothetical protein B7C24_07575 [Bacteroidetes bacterium 4572_77]